VAHWGEQWGIGRDFRPRLIEKWLYKPLSWKKPRVVAAGFMGDIACLQGPAVSKIIGVIDATPQHTYLLLTKDPERFREGFRYWQQWNSQRPLPNNVIMMATARNQEDADRVIPALFRIPAARYGLSVEPCLGPVDLTAALQCPWVCEFCFRTSTAGKSLPADWVLVWQSAVCPECQKRVAQDGGYGVVKGMAYATGPDPRPWRKPDWVVVGCESGHGARWGALCGDGRLCEPSQECREMWGAREGKCSLGPHAPQVLDWTRYLVAQCQAVGVPVMVKQCVAYIDGKWQVTSDLDRFPPDLRIVERPF